MQDISERLTDIGFGSLPREPSCWHTARLDMPAPRPARSRPEPACSRSLLRWRDLLSRPSPPSPYRVYRA